MQESLAQSEKTPLRAAISARYSSVLARSASIEDQNRNCYEYAEMKGWIVLDEFVKADEAKTGRTLRNRHGLEFLLTAAQSKPRPFDVLLVDEASRLARKLKDILSIAEDLSFAGVKLVLVNLRLESDDPNFAPTLTLHGMMDEQNSQRSKERVLRGQRGRFLEGFATGSRCFGYKPRKVAQIGVEEIVKHADSQGTKWEVIESEAITIRRVFQMFVDGQSIHQIACVQNEKAIPAARRPRIGDFATRWNPNFVKGILRQTKYIGDCYWNKTSQILHPKTGAVVTRPNPRSKWEFIHNEDLRIVSDELWAAAQDRLRIVNEKMTARRIGGINRAKRKDYLFSGLLSCGLCGESISISGTTGYPVYQCVGNRYRRGCTNNVRFREDRLAAQLVHAIQTNLLTSKTVDYMVAAVAGELDKYLIRTDEDPEAKRKAAQNKISELNAGIQRAMDRLLDPDLQYSRALSARLAEMEVDLEKAKNELELLVVPQELPDVKAKLQKLVVASVSDLLAVLKQDVPKARMVLQQHIKMLRLIPHESANGAGYMLFGEIDLFVPPGMRNGHVLLDRSFIRTIQQYTDYLYRFMGPVIYARGGLSEVPVLAPLRALLNAKPELLHTPLPAKSWSKHLSGLDEQDRACLDRLDSHVLTKDFESGAATLKAELGFSAFRYCRVQYYMFSGSQVVAA